MRKTADQQVADAGSGYIHHILGLDHFGRFAGDGLVVFFYGLNSLSGGEVMDVGAGAYRSKGQGTAVGAFEQTFLLEDAQVSLGGVVADAEGLLNLSGGDAAGVV